MAERESERQTEREREKERERYRDRENINFFKTFFVLRCIVYIVVIIF